MTPIGPSVMELIDRLTTWAACTFVGLVLLTGLLCCLRRFAARPGIVGISLGVLGPGTVVIVGMLWGLAWVIGR